MLLKIRKDKNGWLLFDNAESLQIESDKIKFTEDRDIAYFMNQGEDIVVNTSINNTLPTEAIVIKFSRSGKSHVIAFDTLLYILNDQGRTVEKLVCTPEHTGRKRERNDKNRNPSSKEN